MSARCGKCEGGTRRTTRCDGYLEGLGIFSCLERWEAQTLAPRFVDICRALDTCRPEGTEGVRAFKTQLLRAKRQNKTAI